MPSAMDISSLRSAERSLRDLVDACPESADARRDLAWCLLVQVFYRAGYEDCFRRVTAEDNNQAAEESLDFRSITEMLAECLWQATVLPSLTSDDAARIERDRLISIARMAGRSDDVEAAQLRGDQALRDLIRDLASAADQSADLPTTPTSTTQ